MTEREYKETLTRLYDHMDDIEALLYQAEEQGNDIKVQQYRREQKEQEATIKLVSLRYATQAGKVYVD